MAKEVTVTIPVGLADETAAKALRRYGSDARALHDLYFRMWCYCRREKTDGFVADEDLCVLVLPDPPRIGDRDAKRLGAAGLIERAVGGWLVPAYVIVNGSRADAERQSEVKSVGARRANHDRWHIKCGMPNPQCVYCQSTDQCTDVYSDQSTDELSDQTSDQSTDRCTDPMSDQRSDPADQAVLFKEDPPHIVPPAGQDDDPDPRFTEFWAVYPRRVGKPRARKAWRAAMRRRDDPDLIIKAAVRYRDDPRRDPEYTAHPSTWLNDERYNDEPALPGNDNDDFWES